MTERQTQYTPAAPYIRPDYITIQSWQTGYTACVMTDRKTYRLFDEGFNGIIKQIIKLRKGEGCEK